MIKRNSRNYLIGNRRWSKEKEEFKIKTQLTRLLGKYSRESNMRFLPCPGRNNSRGV